MPITAIPTQQSTIVLVGNPNSGKSSLFNRLTGMRQKTGNYPGVTVDKKSGTTTLHDQQRRKVIDLPGSYSIFPTTEDEKIAAQEILTEEDGNQLTYVYVADVTRLEKQLLLFTQLISLGKRIILCLNMADLIDDVNSKKLVTSFEEKFSVPVIAVSSKTGFGIDRLKQALALVPETKSNRSTDPFFKPDDFPIMRESSNGQTQNYTSFVTKVLEKNGVLSANGHSRPNQRAEDKMYKEQVQDTLKRFSILEPFLHQIDTQLNPEPSRTDALDRVLTHRYAGPAIFILLMLLVFQAIFAWAQYPMGLIESGFGLLNEWVYLTFPAGWATDLVTEGILAGIGGVLVFIPQIAILFFLIGILEQTGYMARVVFMMDSTLRRFGMNGRSVVALVSGGACAIPAIMSTRNISGWKERMITIMVTPLISCSARIPVYALLIALIVPYEKVWGIFNLQGLAFALLYFLGGFMALAVGWVLKKILKTGSDSFLMLEMPEYTWPDWHAILYTVYNKVRTFVVEAGKVIFVISIILWFLASYGPPDRMANATQFAIEQSIEQDLTQEETDVLVSTTRIENSYAGIMGKTIEPIIRPIGFDWKIGIALITSFAAREVFVGTMATIYSIGSEDNVSGLQQRLQQATFSDTGEKVYTPATVWSLLLFYAFAMQCMSTLAVVRKETNSWKWPMIQFAYLTILAYFSSFIIYQILS